ncbi:hypothetical protein [Tahibacter amnicola]|uniref:Uncharacterized protein n=1 Tax=Tahibacter amnicola TaxID=2976241 RepID=A0ABY6BLP4_9GAMM|nr:hypothetical protein [Tahibacter amnicola]UXI69310.1 hypothetical protein N4264_06585 [Tahibacter amnicola]
MTMLKPIAQATAAAAMFTFSVPALSASRIVPENPLQFEQVHLRQRVDSCVFYEQSVTVYMQGPVISVRHSPAYCFTPDDPEIVDIYLGSFPPGEYRVEYYEGQAGTPMERINFVVTNPVTVAIFPPQPFPIADYSGHWWSPGESGWGLTLDQGVLYSLFGTLYVFDNNRLAHWYTVQAGTWETSTRWHGEIVESSGPPWSAPNYDERDANHSVVGTAEFDFSMEPGQEGKARFRYTINGITAEKSIARFRL